MIKARKRFVRYAMLSVFLLLTVLLGIINGISFTMASEDADHLTQMLADSQGLFNPGEPKNQGSRGMMNLRNGQPVQSGPMGPEAPDTTASLRYFTYAFDSEGNAEKIAFSISAVTEEDALAWARALVDEHATGWTARTYRYRVYNARGKTFVTVIDQGRELVGPYRILYISLIGIAVGLVLSYLVLMYLGKRMFQPLEEADRRQKRFIADAEKEFRTPLTVINANTEILERESGENEQTQSINRQVKRMITLVRNLGTAGVFDEQETNKISLDLSSLIRAAGDAAQERFAQKGLRLEVQAGEDIHMEGDSEAIGDLISELFTNAEKFAQTHAELQVRYENGRVSLIASNDTSLPDGRVDQVFDRFTRLENAAELPGAGLGLSHVREIARAHNGRVIAEVRDGIFILRINL